jgi:hypothetical protein
MTPKHCDDEESSMSNTVANKMRLCAATVSGCAAITLMGLATHLTMGTQLHAADAPDGQAVVVTTPSDVPAITKAVPSITGPAPLYAGEAPDTNPQAQIP